jgi:hypothetical protein
MTRGRLLLRIAATIFAFVCVTPAPATQTAIVEARATAIAPAMDAGTQASDPIPTFRLGNAAGRFGSSTAIGDFNADGRLDAIVADRVAPRADGYSYRIAFTMSGQAPEQVTFESTRDAVAITVSDVDRDNDLDVVARAVLSGETVGLWLNDGHGHFTSADARTVPAIIEATQTVGVTEDSGEPLISAEPPRRVSAAALPIAYRAPPAATHQQFLASASVPALACLSLTSGAPRAPPQPSLAFFA